LVLSIPEIEAVLRDELGYDPVITSAVDGPHSYGSAHHRGDAIDVRTWLEEEMPMQIAWARKERLAKRLQDKLGPAYDVVPERTHIHIEFHPKTLEQWRTILV
jgi:hypothetical protein